MQRPITRKLLASAIEYAAEGKLQPLEFERFFTTHYPDEIMERARRDAARLLTSGAPPLPEKVRAELHQIASGLRLSA